MVAGKSPEWLPPGFSEKVKYKNGRKIKYYVNVATGAKYNSKKEVLSSATTGNVSNGTPEVTHGTPQTTNDGVNGLSSNVETGEKYNSKNIVLSSAPTGNVSSGTPQVTHGTPQTTNDDVNGLSSNKVVHAVLGKTNDTPDWLPNGWIVEEKARQNSTRKDKVYIDTSSGSRFPSKAAVARYLKSIDPGNTTTVQNKIDIVDEPLPETPMTSAGPNPEKKKENGSSKKVATVSISADGLPPGWVKEIRTCKTREYPVYVDSSSGKKFSSKAAVTRYLNSLDHANTPTVQNKLDNVDEPLPEMSPQLPMTSAGLTPEKKKKKSSSKKVPTVSTSADGLPPGWITEIRTSKSGNKIRKHQVYIDSSSGTRLFSKAAVARYVNSAHDNTTTVQNKIDNVVNEHLPNMSRPLSMPNASPISEKKKKESSFITVATEIASPDGLPPGWIKEIRTCQSGDKIRKEPYYIDPVTGYELRSKPDVFRYLKTGDIRNCMVRPKRKASDDLKLTQNEIPVSEQANLELQELTSKCTYWREQAESSEKRLKALEDHQKNYEDHLKKSEERSKALEDQLKNHDDHLKKAKEKEARLVVTLEASLSREEEKGSQLESLRKGFEAIKADLISREEEKSSQVEALRKELESTKAELVSREEENGSQLKAVQNELEERRKEIEGLKAELLKEKEKVFEMGGVAATKGFDVNSLDPFRAANANNANNVSTGQAPTSAGGVVPEPQEYGFASLFSNDDDRGQGQGQSRWPRYF